MENLKTIYLINILSSFGKNRKGKSLQENPAERIKRGIEFVNQYMNASDVKTLSSVIFWAHIF